MLEDLFSVVKVRFNGDKADDDKKKDRYPKGSAFQVSKMQKRHFYGGVSGKRQGLSSL